MISVIIPCKNHGEYLEECILSILNQDVDEDVEIIVVNDNSEDNTKEVCENFKGKIKSYNKKFNHACKARNFGFKKSKGKYVLFFDADNFMKPNFLEEHLKEIKKGYGFAYSDRQLIGAKEGSHNTKEFDKEKELRKGYIDTAGLVKREYVGKWDSNLKGYQDWDFWCSVIENGGDGKFIDKKLWYYRMTGEISKKTRKDIYELSKYIHKKHEYGKDKITLALPVCGRWFCVEEFLESVFRLEYQKEEINLIVIDNSNDEEFNRYIKGRFSEHNYNSFDLIKNEMDKKDTHKLRHMIVKKNMDLIKENTKTSELMIIEDDTIVPKNTIKKLQKEFRKKEMAWIEGVELSRWQKRNGGIIGAGNLVLIEEFFEDKGNNIGRNLSTARNYYNMKENWKEKGIEKIDFGGFYCLYTSLACLQNIPIKVDTGDKSITGPDVLFGLDTRKLGLQGYIDWSIKCKHINLTSGGVIEEYVCDKPNKSGKISNVRNRKTKLSN